MFTHRLRGLSQKKDLSFDKSFFNEAFLSGHKTVFANEDADEVCLTATKQ